MRSQVAAIHDRLLAIVDELRAAVDSASAAELCSILIAHEAATRALDQVAVSATAAAQRQDVFTERGYRSAADAMADLLRWEPRRSRRFVTAAERVAPRFTLDGTELPPTLVTTAAVFAAGETSMRHVEVISALLATKAAERIEPQKWAAAECELAAHAPDYTPAELHAWGTQMIEALDEDGPEPDDRPEPQINELRLIRHRNRPGGRITGRFDDAEMFDAVATVVDAKSAPADADDPRSAPERQAEALAEACGYLLAQAPARMLPESGGRRPQVVVTVRLEDLEARARSAMLEIGGRLTPAEVRMLACDAAVVPVVLGGNGQPLDVGRIRRTVPDGLRRAVTARDLGCAHPGCDRPPAWCEIHHVLPWESGGTTEIGNLVMLCRIHHRLVHRSGWTVRIVDGRPEFVPPGWIDPHRRPRRRPHLSAPVPAGAEVQRLPEQVRAPDVEFGPPAVRVADFADLDVLA